MAGVIVELGAQNGLIVPLIAVHLFVFYFGILADDTPPVGLGAFAASAISAATRLKPAFKDSPMTFAPPFCRFFLFLTPTCF